MFLIQVIKIIRLREVTVYLEHAHIGFNYVRRETLSTFNINTF
jgi:hypothetical protein